MDDPTIGKLVANLMDRVENLEAQVQLLKGMIDSTNRALSGTLDSLINFGEGLLPKGK